MAYIEIMDIRDQLRQARETTGWTKSGLAVKAGLHKDALTKMDDPKWNPSARTIEKVVAVLRQAKEISL